jgi:hypothetical protein
MCQYSTELMSFTLDSLIAKDVQNNLQVSTGILYLNGGSDLFLWLVQ